MSRFVSCLLFYVSALTAQPSNRELIGQIDDTLADLAKVTGLPVKGTVDREFITREKLKDFLQTRINESIKPEELRIEELTLKLFGFVPPSYDLKASTISLLTEQAAAFYDYRKKKMFLLEGAPEISQRFVLIHELAHALADQHFTLEKYIQQGRNDDSATARMAVMEGQAQWLMYEVMAQKTGQSLQKDQSMVRMFVNASSVGLSDYPELSKAPLYIRESLLFPYTKGLVFQQEVVERLGDKGFREVFARPPSNTRQILHPGLYFEKAKPAKARAPKLPGDYTELTDGDFGEFDIHVLIQQHTDEETADKLAPHWRGGRYRVGEHKSSKKPALTYALAFDSADAAGQFETFYKTKVAPSKTAARFARKGAAVQITEGLE
ncbi:MAG: ImmA/IrrE family metallo-endopeptidase [Acidobacteria bacterium]|nr:ImmA/IrrE family metallo-endopeptidase [Acidobacteriota bacterium]